MASRGLGNGALRERSEECVGCRGYFSEIDSLYVLRYNDNTASCDGNVLIMS